MRVMSLKVLVVALMLGAGCANSPSAPASSNIDILIVFSPVAGPDGGEFTARLEAETYTLPGAVKATLGQGIHQITGTFRGAGFIVGFATIGEGGVKSGSVNSLAGPSPKITSCAITYASQSSTERVTFQMQFQVTDSQTAACGPPAP
jgi:hypothetical protein